MQEREQEEVVGAHGSCVHSRQFANVYHIFFGTDARTVRPYMHSNGLLHQAYYTVVRTASCKEREQEETVGTHGSCVRSRHFTQNTPLSDGQSCPNVPFIQGKCVSLHVEMSTHNRDKSAQNLQSRPVSAINRREKSYINTTSYERL